MANSLTAVVRQLLAQGLLALRQQAIAPRLVNLGYSAMAGERGSSIDVPIPSAVTVRDVVPGVTPAANQDSTPSKVTINLDQWKEASFYLTDKEQMEVQDGHFPSQASEAIKALANTVDAYILGFYNKVFSYGGTAGTTPFASDLVAYTDARKWLNTWAAPFTDRRVLLGVDAEANALKLPIFLQADQRGDQQGIIEGLIGRKIGADWFLDQNIPTHTSPAFSAGAVTVNGVNAVNAGSTDNGRTGTVSIAKATNAHQLVAGDILTIAGDSQPYVVLAPAPNLIVGNTTVTIAPALKKATAGGEVVTKLATHVANLLFHRDWFAFANRPLVGAAQGLGNIIESAVDPVSGLTLRLEVSRQHKQTTFSYDILYGGQAVRPELAARILG